MQNEVTIECNSISQVLEELHSSQVVPIGAFGRMFAVLDALRATRAPVEHISLAEQISVALLRLERTMRNRDGDAEASVREKLKTLSELWAEICRSPASTNSFSVTYDVESQLEAAA